MIKNGEMVRRRPVITSAPPSTDDQSDSNPKIVNYALIPNTCSRTKSVSNPSSTQQANINPGLSIAIINCQSISVKKASFASFSSDHQISLQTVNFGSLHLYPHQKFSQMDIQCTKRTERTDTEVFIACMWK